MQKSKSLYTAALGQRTWVIGELVAGRHEVAPV
jgi:hypothetical protein